MSEQGSRVRRRRVFHIPGYDPIHPRRYRELYRTQSAAQADFSGYDIAVKAHSAESGFCWLTKARIDGQEVQARVDVLVWSDIVRKSMARTIPATYLQLAQTAWIYVMTGTLQRLMRMRKGPVIAALYPVAMLLLQLAFAVIVGGYVGGAVQAGLNELAGMTGLSEGALSGAFTWGATGLKYGVWVGVVLLLLRWFKSKDHKVLAYYLMHDYAFSARHWGANPPALDTRLSEFAKVIADSFTEDVDEVLVVGHSSGAHLAISVLADLLRSGRVPQKGPKLALLTLGQVVPMMSFLPDAWQLRSDLAYLATCDAITWVDVSAPGDGCCFALCDPVAVTGVAPPGKRWPLVISAAFTQSLSPARWKELRWRFFRLHFQYLCAFDQPGDYDYFQITAGPLTLADRYRDRHPSQSRIDVAVSKYTSFAP
ncbi:hypothetical protein [Yoonia sediminilitoris]|uniref:Uncharacterized protein n=1 Tax=Yoonia sediminilitoris TaxID=1286148 RepID=A0A2T6K949_9RHOB|nr:hypothetical protein [Yoonia sediminilitoris]PUB11292.1 hypothetical protein C8N45_11465 [Yoonia sediminilitoris]RCW91108.1 hypothetical protein DFP92_11465 [Yoonia sediminilitoris]